MGPTSAPTRTPLPNEASKVVYEHQVVHSESPLLEDAESEDSDSESLEERELKKDSETDLKEFSKDSSPLQLNSHLPGEEEENKNVGNPFPKVIFGNPKCLNGYELLEQALSIKRLEKTELIDMIYVGYPRDTFHRLKQAIN